MPLDPPHPGQRFHIGQRVRINCPTSNINGYEATVMSDLFLGWVVDQPGKHMWVWHYRVLVHGVGEDNGEGLNFGFEQHELEPLLPPEQFTITIEYNTPPVVSPETVPEYEIAR